MNWAYILVDRAIELYFYRSCCKKGKWCRTATTIDIEQFRLTRALHLFSAVLVCDSRRRFVLSLTPQVYYTDDICLVHGVSSSPQCIQNSVSV
jgi:hypothetical protein